MLIKRPVLPKNLLALRGLENEGGFSNSMEPNFCLQINFNI